MQQNPSQTNQKVKSKNLKKTPIKPAELLKSLVLLFAKLKILIKAKVINRTFKEKENLENETQTIK